MTKYLGETIINDLVGTPFEDFTTNDWVLYYMGYGQIDGAHHKQWTLDQIARIVNGTKIIVKLARWDDGSEEYRVTLDKPSRKYLKWVKEMRGEYDEEEYEYGYDEGIAP